MIATSTAADGAYIRGLGADELIDFENEDVVTRAQELAPDGVDAVLDLVSDAEQLARIGTVLRPGGRIVSLIFSADIEALAARDIRAANILSHPVAEHFEHLARLVDGGNLQVPTELVLPPEEALAALELSESGRARGKIVLAIS